MNSIAPTLQMRPGFSDLYRRLRRHAEALAAGCVFGLVAVNRTIISTAFATKSWHLDGYYSALFNWSAIQTGFIFSAYAFFVSRSEPFLRAIDRTETFAALRRYVVRSLMTSVLLALVTLPSLVATPAISITTNLDFPYALLVFVSTLATYSFMCFLKIVRVFMKIENSSRRG
jgi:hypothetical protein